MMTVPPSVRHVIFDYGGTLADLVFPFTLFRRFSPTTTEGSGEVKPPHWLQRQARKVAYPVAARLFVMRMSFAAPVLFEVSSSR